MAKRAQPQWNPPPNKDVPKLKLYNSLTREKEVFVPQCGNRVLWYSCGPTVYDASHMGHARSYISFDILRRVMSDYFGYDILYVMNITDIDDKIIKRARQNHLYEQYLSKNHTLDEILEDAKSVMLNFESTIKKTTDPDKKDMFEKMFTQVEKANENLQNAVTEGDKSKIDDRRNILLKEIKDPLSEWLDVKNGTHVTEHSIFNKLSQHWEAEFHKDMDALNVMKPNVLTRVSEYVPEIIEFIEKLITHDFAYESGGSVYFNVGGFDKKPHHHYAKLVPEAYGDISSLNEGEGDLSVSTERLSEKISSTDFALWKSSKGGEPWWESPWGRGRPGWHIECSVMASVICGDSLDIHTGGVDLKFPHHDNELAQAEAYFDHSHWVRYFLHSGHLTIAGCKMSKSLKNFITIQEALKTHTARQLRLAFLLHSWKDTLDYSDNTMNMVIQYEKFLNEFFLNVKSKIRNLGTENVNEIFTKWSNLEMDLNKNFSTAKSSVHESLCDNIDTRSVLLTIKEFITQCNKYMQQSEHPNILLLRDIGVYVTKIFSIFGAIASSQESIGFPINNETNPNAENMVMPYLEVLSNFREKIRDQAKTLKANDILKECDNLRDEILPNIGVRLEDDNNTCTIKLVNREELMKEKEAKKTLELLKAIEKENKKAEAAAAAAIKEAQKKIPPSEMFKMEKDKYSQFDEDGLPTHDAEGEEISKGQIKKLMKLQQAQEKKYKEYLASLEDQG